MMRFNDKKTAVALGTFDGLHKGHMSVINKAVIQRDNGLLPVIMLFSSHPEKSLTGKAPKELFSGRIKECEIKKTGCIPFVVSFDEIRNMSPREFFCKILLCELNAGFVSCGFNFKFAKNGSGDINVLSELCNEYGVGLSVADEVDYDNEPISSTRIRNAVADGDIQNANEMLGRYFTYDFTVKHGDNRGGRVFGFPTINQYFPPDFIVPKYGVYASFTTVDGTIYPSVTNIGIRPTIGTELTGSETYIHGYDGDLYEKNPAVSLISYIRAEQKFPSFDRLSAQMKTDCEKSLEIFENEAKKWE